MARGQGHSVVNFLLVLQGFSPFPPAWGKAGMGGRDRMCCLPALHTPTPALPRLREREKAYAEEASWSFAPNSFLSFLIFGSIIIKQ